MPETQETTQAIFCLEDVHYAYGQGEEARRVLCGVDFALRPGQHVGLYGPNGSGKTTFFRCITGLARPATGRSAFSRTRAAQRKRFLRPALRRGFCPAARRGSAFFPHPCWKTWPLAAEPGAYAEAARARALETLERLGLAGFEQRLTHRLSGGEKKLVSLATVLAMKPEALLLDEPTNGLDNAARERIIQILQTLDTARITISHDWDFLERTSSQYLTIDNGRLDTCAPSLAHAHLHAHPLGNRPHDHG